MKDLTEAERHKLDKLIIADEVYGWWAEYKLSSDPVESKEPKMTFGVWLLHSINKIMTQQKEEGKEHITVSCCGDCRYQNHCPNNFNPPAPETPACSDFESRGNANSL